MAKAGVAEQEDRGAQDSAEHVSREVGHHVEKDDDGDDTVSGVSASAGGLNRHRDFNLLWASQSVSVVGSEITELALPLVAIITLNATASQVGYVNAARTLPGLLIVLFAGVFVDRNRRRNLMIWSNLTRAATVLMVPLLVYIGYLSIAWLCAITFFLGAATILFDLAYHSYVPTLVGKEDLVGANSRLQTSNSVAGIAGPGLGGVLVGVFGAATAMLFDAASYLVSVVLLGGIDKKEPAPERSRSTSMLSEAWSGLRLTMGSSHLRALALESAIFNFFIQVFLTLVLLYGSRDLELSPSALGLALAAGSAGGFLGALAVGRVTRFFGLGRTAVASVVIAAAGPAIVPLIGRSPFTLPLLLLAFAITLFGVVLSAINSTVLRQGLTPNEVLGRVTASGRLLTGGLLPVASLVAGALGTAFGARTGLAVAAAGLPLAAVPLLFSPLPKIKTMDDLEPLPLD